MQGFLHFPYIQALLCPSLHSSMPQQVAFYASCRLSPPPHVHWLLVMLIESLTQVCRREGKWDQGFACFPGGDAWILPRLPHTRSPSHCSSSHWPESLLCFPEFSGVKDFSLSSLTTTPSLLGSFNSLNYFYFGNHFFVNLFCLFPWQDSKVAILY